MSVVNIGSRLAPGAHWRDAQDGEHFVQFYDEDEALVDAVAGYLGAALKIGSAGIVIATPEHREAISQHLRGQSIDVPAAIARGQYVPLDAADTLDQFHAEGELSRESFEGLLGPMIDTARHRFGRVYCFGEMVALLWKERRRETVVRLEQLWNELRRRHDFTLFCAYPMAGFDAVGHEEPFAGVCAQHSSVIPAESYSAHRSADERLLTICRLQQKAAALEKEVEQRARLEQELERRVAELAVVARRKDEFLAMLGHELRNPLAPIRNVAELLARSDAENSERRPMYELLGRQIRHLSHLLDELLDVARITQGRIELHPEPLELMAVISSAIETCRPLIDARHHHIAVSLPEEPLRIKGDRVRLVQSFGNLLNNAAKFTPEAGHIGIRAERVDDRVRIRVTDDGIGISPDVLPTIFELFAQADHTLDRAGGGLGVGLTVVRTIVELHGGTVEARSAGFGLGSELLVELPLMDLVAVDDACSATSPAGTAPKQLLIVDDNRDAAESLAMLLRLGGHTVTTVYDGAAALESVRAMRPDVVLLDLGLPGVSGYDAGRRIREMHPGVRLFAVTGYGQARDFERTREAGFDGHFVKPVDPASIEKLLAAESAAG